MAHKFKTEIDMQGNKIVALAEGTAGTDAVNVDQLNAAVVGGTAYQGGYNAATNTPNLTAGGGSVLLGYQYTVNVAGTFLGEDVEQGDMIFAKVDNPTTLADFNIVNKNTQPIGNATETAPGIVELSNTAENNAGTDNTRAVTPAGMAVYVAANAPAPADASETVKGVAEISTQPETDAGIDDTRMITPKKLGLYIENTNVTRKSVNQVTLGDAAGNVTVTHNLGSKHFSVTAQDASTGEEWEVEVVSKSATTVVVAGSGTAQSFDIICIG